MEILSFYFYALVLKILHQPSLGVRYAAGVSRRFNQASSDLAEELFDLRSFKGNSFWEHARVADFVC